MNVAGCGNSCRGNPTVYRHFSRTCSPDHAAVNDLQSKRRERLIWNVIRRRICRWIPVARPPGLGLGAAARRRWSSAGASASGFSSTGAIGCKGWKAAAGPIRSRAENNAVDSTRIIRRTQNQKIKFRSIQQARQNFRRRMRDQSRRQLFPAPRLPGWRCQLQCADAPRRVLPTNWPCWQLMVSSPA